MSNCPDCGAHGVNGRAGCQALYDEITARAYDDWRYAAKQTLAFDTYCMQHPDTYCRSAKSYAAHLTRLCCGLEFDGRTAVYTAIQQWLNGQVVLEKPPVLTARGSLTIAEITVAQLPEEHNQLVQEWAKNVWDAYAWQQELARQWVAQALAFKERR